MRDAISSGIGSLLSVMASHVRRCSKLGADAPHHFPRISIFFDHPQSPWPLSLDGPDPCISRVRTILSRISQDLSYRPPGASHPHDSRPRLLFSTRIPTGV